MLVGDMERNTKFEKVQSQLTGKKLLLGCGQNSKKGWVNLDVVPLDGVDIVHDLDIFPYPFKDSSFEYIHAQHVFEHLTDIVKVMEECHRILNKKGRLEIIVPYYKSRNAFTDPTHKHFFTEYSMDYFTINNSKVHIDWYSEKKFKVLWFKKYNNAFPFWHIKKRLGWDLKVNIFSDTLHWVLEVVK